MNVVNMADQVSLARAGIRPFDGFTDPAASAAFASVSRPSPVASPSTALRSPSDRTRMLNTLYNPKRASVRGLFEDRLQRLRDSLAGRGLGGSGLQTQAERDLAGDEANRLAAIDQEAVGTGLSMEERDLSRALSQFNADRSFNEGSRRFDANFAAHQPILGGGNRRGSSSPYGDLWGNGGGRTLDLNGNPVGRPTLGGAAPGGMTMEDYFARDRSDVFQGPISMGPVSSRYVDDNRSQSMGADDEWAIPGTESEVAFA